MRPPEAAKAAAMSIASWKPLVSAAAGDVCRQINRETMLRKRPILKYGSALFRIVLTSIAGPTDPNTSASSK